MSARAVPTETFTSSFFQFQFLLGSPFLLCASKFNMQKKRVSSFLFLLFSFLCLLGGVSVTPSVVRQFQTK